MRRLVALAGLATGCARPEVAAHRDRELVTTLVVTVRDAPAGAIEVVCVAEDDPDERLTASVDDDATPKLRVRGARADVAYGCAAAVEGEPVGDARVAAEALPEDLPTVWVERGAAASWGAWTLASHQRAGPGEEDAKLVVFDPEGRIRWYAHDRGHDPDDLDAMVLPDDTILYGGGFATPPTQVDLDGEIWWEAPDPPGGGVYNHHVEAIPGEGVLAITTAPNTAGDVTWFGFRLVLWDPATDAVRWSWDSQSAVDDGALPLGTERSDPYHANWATLVTDDAGPAAYVSLRNLSRLLRIDRDTGRVSWWVGPGSGFQLEDSDGVRLDPSRWFYGQHGPDLALPTVVLYDNGWGRPPPLRSRAVELSVDPVARRVTETWSWDGGEAPWDEPIWGDADALPNGNVLVTIAHSPNARPGAPPSRIVEVSRAGEVAWALHFDRDDDLTYRSERLDGCRLFANAKYCDAPDQ